MSDPYVRSIWNHSRCPQILVPQVVQSQVTTENHPRFYADCFIPGKLMQTIAAVLL